VIHTSLVVVFVLLVVSVTVRLMRTLAVSHPPPGLEEGAGDEETKTPLLSEDHDRDIDLSAPQRTHPHPHPQLQQQQQYPGRYDQKLPLPEIDLSSRA